MRILRTSLLAIIGIALLPAVMLWLLLRPAMRPAWRERLGLVDAPSSGRVWLHGASLGEAQLVANLGQALDAAGVPCFASSGTPTGRAALADRAPGTPQAFAPIDHPASVSLAFRRIRPRALVLIETELWPFLIWGAIARDVPVFVASGRISDRSFPRYLWLRPLFGPLLSRLAGVAARTERDAERFVALGVPPERVRTLGDLKREPSAGGGRIAAELVRALEGQPVCIAGSTHPGEEAALLDALSHCERRGESAVLVLAPRHLERLAAVLEEASSRGRRVVRRTRLDGARLEAGDVLVLDTTGELAALYATASVAFVGGSLVPIGGHNLLEPVFQGAPVVMGPHTESVRQDAQALLACGAAIEVAGASELGETLLALLRDPKEARARGEAGRSELAGRGGVTRRTVEWLCASLAARDDRGREGRRR